nr:hypothetical protein [Tanacetum cinerariifolium]
IGNTAQYRRYQLLNERQAGFELRPQVLVLLGQQQVSAQLGQGLIHGEAGVFGGNLEEHAARLTERVAEHVGQNLGRGLDAGQRERDGMKALGGHFRAYFRRRPGGAQVGGFRHDEFQFQPVGVEEGE